MTIDKAYKSKQVALQVQEGENASLHEGREDEFTFFLSSDLYRA